MSAISVGPFDVATRGRASGAQHLALTRAAPIYCLIRRRLNSNLHVFDRSGPRCVVVKALLGAFVFSFEMSLENPPPLRPFAFYSNFKAEHS